MKFLKSFSIVMFLLCSCLILSSFFMLNHEHEANDEILKRGEYLVAIMDCHACHSPKRMGPQGPELIPELLLSGYPSDRPIPKFDSPMLKEGFTMFMPDLTATAGPWGVSFAANITPHETGIGTWTESHFKKSITEGKHKGLENGRPIMPPMPWQSYSRLSDEDIHALYTYLKSVAPVENVVPSIISPDKM